MLTAKQLLRFDRNVFSGKRVALARVEKAGFAVRELLTTKVLWDYFGS